jgi:hypothetical protein
MTTSKNHQTILCVSEYIAIGLGMILGSYLMTSLLQISWTIEIANPTILFIFNLIPVFLLIASLFIYIRFYLKQEPIKSNEVKRTFFSNSEIRFLGKSFLMGIVLVTAIRSITVLMAWVFNVLGL